jgi:dTDP-glucose 4,6-dehydratase
MPRHSFEQGLEATVRWYLEHLDWCKTVKERAGYGGERIGMDPAATAAT